MIITWTNEVVGVLWPLARHYQLIPSPLMADVRHVYVVGVTEGKYPGSVLASLLLTLLYAAEHDIRVMGSHHLKTHALHVPMLTTSSQAKIHMSSTSRIRALDYQVPPTYPSTPSSNPAALRLTMPMSSSCLKVHAPISAVFPPSSSATPHATSPILPHPPLSLSLHLQPGTCCKLRVRGLSSRDASDLRMCGKHGN